MIILTSAFSGNLMLSCILSYSMLNNILLSIVHTVSPIGNITRMPKTQFKIIEFRYTYNTSTQPTFSIFSLNSYINSYCYRCRLIKLQLYSRWKWQAVFISWTRTILWCIGYCINAVGEGYFNKS